MHLSFILNIFLLSEICDFDWRKTRKDGSFMVNSTNYALLNISHLATDKLFLKLVRHEWVKCFFVSIVVTDVMAI